MSRDVAVLQQTTRAGAASDLAEVRRGTLGRIDLVFGAHATRFTRRALVSLLLAALIAVQDAGAADIVSQQTAPLLVKEIFGLDDLRAMRDALAAYLAAHPPATRTTLPPDWRDHVPVPKGEPHIQSSRRRIQPRGAIAAGWGRMARRRS
jgi:hypothetical protein